MAGLQIQPTFEHGRDVPYQHLQTGDCSQSLAAAYGLGASNSLYVPNLESSVNAHQNQPTYSEGQFAVHPGPAYVMPLTVRISTLNLRFMKILDSSEKSQVKELQTFYFLQSAELESERFASLNSANGNHCMLTSTNYYFDQQHHSLISRVEKSLQLIEDQLSQQQKRNATKSEGTKPTVNSTVSKSNNVNVVAIRIMRNWYERNSEHPYPSYETAEVMAKAGAISTDQVKKWFANTRRRLGDTKTITEIAKRRKRARTVSKDDIFLTDYLKSE